MGLKFLYTIYTQHGTLHNLLGKKGIETVAKVATVKAKTRTHLIKHVRRKTATSQGLESDGKRIVTRSLFYELLQHGGNQLLQSNEKKRL